MAIFIALAAGLTLAVLAVLLRPLWRDARGVALGIAVIALASSALLYRIVGTPQALDAANLTAPETLGDAIAQLQTELARNPEQAEGWRLLGMAYQRESKPLDAREAYAKAASLAAGNADILTEAAQSRALADAKRLFDANAIALLQAALKADANHQRARWFLGIAQRQGGDNAAAAATWEPLLAQVDAATAASLRKEIDSARVAAGMSPLPAVTSTATALQVKIALDPAFAARVRLRGDASVFVIARAPDGPPMPIAVEKRSVSELPFTATLDDDDSLMPSGTLSQQREVELVARLSASGEGKRQEGDIESKPVRVELPAKSPVILVLKSPR